MEVSYRIIELDGTTANAGDTDIDLLIELVRGHRGFDQIWKYRYI